MLCATKCLKQYYSVTMRFYVFLFLVLFSSCHLKVDQAGQLEPRDSLMRAYLNLGDSISWTDTTDPRHKLLLAYNKNDTAYIKQTLKSAQEALIETRKYPSPTSCFTPQPINSFDFNEAYRFQYEAAFCDQSVNITVGERHDSIFLLAYHYKHDYKTDSCLSVEKTEKLLSAKQWEAIQFSIFRADLWGMKSYNGISGMDGSSLTVIGYQKPKNAFEGRYNKVGRWAAEKSALGESFKLVLDISRIKVPCFHY